MWQFESQVSEVIQRTPTIKSFRFPIRTKGVRYLPGQFFFLTIKVGGRDAIHHFSFSTSPTDKGYIEFTKRITESDFSQALDAITPGTWGQLKGPEGRFTLPRKERRLAFLSGGIGITPLRSMFRYLVARNLAYDVVLIYGNRSVEEIAFRDELDDLTAAHHSLRVEHVLSGADPPEGWNGKAGHVDKEVVSELIPDYRERLFYVSGPPRMVIGLEQQLEALGIPPQQIRRDSFTGYD